MTVSSARTPATRAPDNELYDRGCDLVEAATAIRRRRPTCPRGYVETIPAVLGCIEAALRELLWALSTGATSAVERAARLQRETDRRAAPTAARSATRVAAADAV